MAEKWKKTALLVIDMQKDFILPEGPIQVNGGPAIVSNVIKAVDVARHRGMLIVWVVREHDPLGRDVELFRKDLYIGGKSGPTIKGHVGAQLVDGLVIHEKDYKLVKTRFSAFFGTHLHSFLKVSGIDSIVVVGVQTPNCIRQTVFDAVALDYPSVTVIVDATAAATPEVHADLVGIFVFFGSWDFLGDDDEDVCDRVLSSLLTLIRGQISQSLLVSKLQIAQVVGLQWIN
ncbi:hypothetical protein Dimus_027728 [Dionaea muscipula]